jgi:hypothetical protein
MSWYPCSTPWPRSVPAAADPATGRTSRTATRHTTTSTSEPTCATAASSPGRRRKGIESSTRLGRHRWVIERTMSWLMRYRRLVRRYDRLADHFQGFVTIACALICYRRLVKVTK